MLRFYKKKQTLKWKKNHDYDFSSDFGQLMYHKFVSVSYHPSLSDRSSHPIHT